MDGTKTIADAPWIAPTTAIVAVVITLAVGLQRDAFVHPGRQTIFLVLAGLPWVIDASTRKFPRVVWVPVVIVCATALYGWFPVGIDYAPFFLVYLAGTMATVLQPRWSIAVAVAAITPGLVLDVQGRITGSVIWLFGVTMAWFFGYGFREQLKLLAQLEDAQATLSETAATTERQRLAREIHDLIAHSLSVTMLHITGARLALDDGDTAEAMAGLAQAEETGREAMNEIRRTVGLLGPGSPTAPAAPTATDVPDLVEGFRFAGLDVHPTITGDLASVPTAQGLALYRIVQESLSNVAKHAAGGTVELAVTVDDATVDGAAIHMTARSTVMRDSSCVTTRVVDGLGIRGMQDRLAVLGGTLTAGPSGGHWVVDATIPL